jgi:hypothetical protein
MSVIVLGEELDETLARVRDQHAIVTSACGALAESLRRGAVDEGLQALERICATLLITEELISSSARAGASGTTLIGAYRLSESMVRRATPWIAAAVRDLPGAEAKVRLFVLAPPHAQDADGPAQRDGGNGHA